MTTIFDPIKLGADTAANRAIMAPLTRGRATRDHVPTPIMVDYYAQRASAGLIISEATGISHQGLGWPSGPTNRLPPGSRSPRPCMTRAG